MGATNRPDELDEAARRRFVKRLYIPLPDGEARLALVTLLLRRNGHALTPAEIQAVVDRTQGFSGADIKSLCTEAAMGPVRVGGWVCIHTCGRLAVCSCRPHAPHVMD